MNNRERVVRAVEFRHPDRIPWNVYWSPGALHRYGERIKPLVERYPNDLAGWTADLPDEEPFQEQDYYRESTDNWGVVRGSRDPGVAALVIKSPLADWEAYDGYQFPAPPDRSDAKLEEERAKVAERKKQYFVSGGGGSMWHLPTYLRGFTNLLMDIADKEPRLFDLLDRLVEHHLKQIEWSLATGVDCIGFGDDLGVQDRLMLNPKDWREIWKPRYKILFDRAHEGGAKVWFHSDGYIIEIVPDLIEIGVDVLNPQFNCHPLDELAHLTKGKLCMVGDIDRQYVLPFGTPQEVKDYVRMCARLFGSPEGGFIQQAGVYPDVPFENAVALLEAFEEFGYLDQWRNG